MSPPLFDDVFTACTANETRPKRIWPFQLERNVAGFRVVFRFAICASWGAR
jgi:hypothetical protein